MPTLGGKSPSRLARRDLLPLELEHNVRLLAVEYLERLLYRAAGGESVADLMEEVSHRG